MRGALPFLRLQAFGLVGDAVCLQFFQNTGQSAPLDKLVPDPWLVFCILPLLICHLSF